MNTVKLVGLIAIILMFSQLLSLTPSSIIINSALVNTKGATFLTVPDDYSTIQKAIDNAKDGDTIFVKKGIYYCGDLTINKSVSLMGEDASTTVIDGQYDTKYPRPWGWITISVRAQNVLITGFNITNCEVAINIGSFNARILANNFQHNSVGINGGGRETDIVISDNNFTNNWQSGMSLSCQNSDIINNLFYDNLYALTLNRCENITVCYNQIINNTYGLDLSLISKASVFGNNINRNYDALNYNGFGISFASNCINTLIYDNNVLGNTQGIVSNDVHLEQSTQGSGNIIFSNNLVDNKQNANVTDFGGLSASVSWDNGTLGNYWGDYLMKYPNATEIDSSGVGNIPYTIIGDNIDGYPLLQPVDITPGEPTPASLNGTDLAPIIVIISVAVLVTLMISVILIKRQKKL